MKYMKMLEFEIAKGNTKYLQHWMDKTHFSICYITGYAIARLWVKTYLMYYCCD